MIFRRSFANKTILLPPPNVTGNLHMGHALTISLQASWTSFIIREVWIEAKRSHFFIGRICEISEDELQ